MISRICDLIRHRESFLLTAHVRLDGDALGSELALYALLTDLGKKAVVFNEDPTPSTYRFLPGADRIVNSLDGVLENCDTVIVLDCSDLDRIGETSAARIAASGKTLVNIDHHFSNEGFTELALVDPAASSTGELICRILDALPMIPSAAMATNLYAAILTDTGGFCYSNTTPASLRCAARLVESGASPALIAEAVYENEPPAKMRLTSRAMASLTFDADGAIASMVLLLDDFAAAGALQEHTEGLVEIPRTIEGVRVSVMIIELPDGRFKISLRSKSGIDVEQVARFFGGGGHIHAAACRMRGDAVSVRARLIERIQALGLA